MAAAAPRLLARAPGRVQMFTRTYATSIPAKAHHRIIIVGAGTAGVTVAAQLQRSLELEKKDIAILDPARTHHYQVSRRPPQQDNKQKTKKPL